MDASQNRSNKRVGSLVRGKYRIDAFIATGTMANIYAATHRNGTRCALKILHPQLASDPAIRERFMREGYFANAIGHPGVVRAVDDDVTEDGCAFLVMELLEGETLEERRHRKGGKLPVDWVITIADALLDTLAAAHAHGIVHRDLKPDNVFLTKTGQVKVLDFGVARWNDGKSSSETTDAGTVLGTPAYMPPEQALGRREEVDAQSDIWAVGATLFTVLSGKPVHAGDDARARLLASARTEARPLREVAPDVPRAVAAVIDRALSFQKRGRWPDADAMRQALRWARLTIEAQNLAHTAPMSEGPRPGTTTAPPPGPTRRMMDAETEPVLLDELDESASGPITLRGIATVAPTGKVAAMGLVSAPKEPSRPTRALERVTQMHDEVQASRDTPSEDFEAAAAADRPAESHSSTMPIARSRTQRIQAVVPPAQPTTSAGPSSNANAGAPPGSDPLTSTVPLVAPRSEPRINMESPAQSSPPLGSFPPVWSGGSIPASANPVSVDAAPPSMPGSLRPGPLLAQIVSPKRKRARIAVPFALAGLAVVGIVVAFQARTPRGTHATGAAAEPVPPIAEPALPAATEPRFNPFPPSSSATAFAPIVPVPAAPPARGKPTPPDVGTRRSGRPIPHATPVPHARPTPEPYASARVSDPNADPGATPAAGTPNATTTAPNATGATAAPSTPATTATAAPSTPATTAESAAPDPKNPPEAQTSEPENAPPDPSPKALPELSTPPSAPSSSAEAL